MGEGVDAELAGFDASMAFSVAGCADDRGRGPREMAMLDKLEKTRELVATLKAALPFE
jgi:hypothetical protein